jgi:hypothetical protein
VRRERHGRGGDALLGVLRLFLPYVTLIDRTFQPLNKETHLSFKDSDRTAQ